MIQPENIRQRHFTWDDLDLMFQKRAVCTLVPHKTIPAHWHLKFEWRDEPTPEFFNIFNARENARLYSLQKLSQGISVAPQESLNDCPATYPA